MCVWHYTFHRPCGHWMVNIDRCVNSHCTRLQAALYHYHDQPDTNILSNGRPAPDPQSRPHTCRPIWPTNPQDLPLRAILPHPSPAAEHHAYQGWARFHGPHQLDPYFRALTGAPERCTCLGWRDPHHRGASWSDPRAPAGVRRCSSRARGNPLVGVQAQLPPRPPRSGSPFRCAGVGVLVETALWGQGPPSALDNRVITSVPAPSDWPGEQRGQASPPPSHQPEQPQQQQQCEHQPTLAQLGEHFQHPTEHDGFVDNEGHFHVLPNVQITQVPYGCGCGSGDRCHSNRPGFLPGELERAVEEEEHIATSYARAVMEGRVSFHEDAQLAAERCGTPELVQRMKGLGLGAEEDPGEGRAPREDGVEGREEASGPDGGAESSHEGGGGTVLVNGFEEDAVDDDGDDENDEGEAEDKGKEKERKPSG